MDTPTAIQLVTAATGLVGTAGGILISYLTLRHTFRKDRHIIKLDMSEAMMLWPQPGTTKPKVTENQLTFRVANVGVRDFMVVSLGIQIGRRSGGLFINQPHGTVTLPYRLEPDKSCDFWTDFDEIKKGIKKPRLYSKVKIRGYIKDYLGNSFMSNSMTIVLKETRRYKAGQWLKKKLKAILTLFRP